MPRLINKILSLTVLSISLSSAYAYADDALDAGNLYKSGQINESLKKIDNVLAQNPKNAQMRFLKGIILAEQNKNAEAITIFTKLTDDYPSLPEPYNNLAVLYASSGQYLKASTALEMAIRTNPTYGTAHENLGDVYAKLASQAYDKALQIDSANPSAKLKLNLVKNLIGNTTGGTVPKFTQPATTTAPTVAAKTPTVNQAAAVSPTVNQATAKPAAVVATPKPAPVATENSNEVLISAVNAWASAWSNQDMKKYLAAYAKDFDTGRQSRNEWEEERKQRIEGKNKINVSVENFNVSVDGNTAVVKFKQHYQSDRLSSKSSKTLTFTKQTGKWLIKQERSGN